jgi:hypothetical protein
LLAVGWLIRERGAEVVELRVGGDCPACQRIAVKSGFSLAGTVSSAVEATGTVVEDSHYITKRESAAFTLGPPADRAGPGRLVIRSQ